MICLSALRALSGLGASLGLVAATAAFAEPETGRDTYNRSCIACHGADGGGTMPGIPDFTAADGPLSKSDAVLLRSITQGAGGSPSTPSMPPLRGDPNLIDTRARDVLEFIRTEFGGPTLGGRSARSETEE